MNPCSCTAVSFCEYHALNKQPCGCTTAEPCVYHGLFVPPRDGGTGDYPEDRRHDIDAQSGKVPEGIVIYSDDWFGWLR